MDKADTSYTLTAAELGAVRALLTLQQVISQEVVSPRGMTSWSGWRRTSTACLARTPVLPTPP